MTFLFPTQEAPIIMEIYKAWGARTTAIDIMELYSALQNKTVDATPHALIQEAVDENQDFRCDRLQEYSEEYYNAIVSSGITIYELTDEERQAFKDASAPVYGTFGADLLNRVQEFLAVPANQ